MSNIPELAWKKYLTREYSFLYISYAVDCYKIMMQKVGATIKFDLAHGEDDLVSLYGINEEFENCYEQINQLLSTDLKKGLQMMDEFEELMKRYYSLVEKIDDCENKSDLKELLIELDGTFLNLLCYYLFFVYLGYGGDKPAIAKFLEENKERFEKLRNCGVDSHMDKEFPHLFGKFNNKFESLISYMSRKDLLNLLEDKELNLEKINQRKKEYLLVTKDGITKEYESPEIRKTLLQEVSELKHLDEINELKGRTACQGVVRGKVTIIHTMKDYPKIKEGDIIVTPMTKPSITTLLSKVKGIITNDGGALCHASIISREMNIPCVVGTIHATEVLKDGDEVLLDANSGIVKKLN
ncbi:hypothetical protein COY27_04820 [Candidatus Woesearchaeota archaeon CG_4_10_14_0_2_um_filter_33_13]|nr:MAG: hypothetical protein COY27_04820 [Candidatus Woesearchaeota archaeon CG_4_10_14_0_2_um_filter_33_13]